MRAITSDENYIDVTQKIGQYLSSDDNGMEDFLSISGDMIDELDQMERIANGIPDEKYRNALLNNISMMRNSMIQNIDIIDDFSSMQGE